MTGGKERGDAGVQAGRSDQASKDVDPILLEYLTGELGGIEKQEPKDAHWAHSVCKASRAVHMRVLIEDPPPPAVDAVVEQLGRLCADVMMIAANAVPEAGKYVDNIEARIDSLKRFKNGQSPRVPDGATKEEQEIVKMVGECRAYARGRR